MLGGWSRIVLVPDPNPTPGMLVDSLDFRLGWMPILGPSATALVQVCYELVTEGLDVVNPDELARMVGLGTGSGRNSRLVGALTRTVDFGITKPLPAFEGLRVPATVAWPSTLQRQRWSPLTCRLLAKVSDHTHREVAR